MYLSKLSLDVSSPSVAQALASSHDMHRNLMKAFDHNHAIPDRERENIGLLYRIVQKKKDAPVLYVQSIEKPYWERIALNGYHLCGMNYNLEKEMEHFLNGSQWRFSILAFPSKKVKTIGQKNSRRQLLTGNRERLSWLTKQGENNGFSIVSATETPEQEKTELAKKSGSFFLSGVRYDGILRITDEEKFRTAFEKGIGPEKAYGYGLLMIAKA